MPTPKKKKAAPGKPSKKSATTPKTIVDKSLKLRFADALDRYRAARTTETASWDERYEVLGEILDAALFLAGGFKDASAFLRAEAPELSQEQARTYIRVARYFDAEDEAKHGVTKLDLLLKYLDAAGGAPIAPARINPDKQVLRVQRGKVTRKVLFAEVTAAELKTLARVANAAGKKAGSKFAPPEVKAVQAALSKAKVRGVAVSVRDGKLALSGIALDGIAAVGKALSTVK